jgi:hypothetical protein
MVKLGATLIFGHCAVGLPGVMLWTKLPSYVPSKAVVVLAGDPSAGAAATAGGGGGGGAGAQAEIARSEIPNKDNRFILNPAVGSRRGDNLRPGLQP